MKKTSGQAKKKTERSTGQMEGKSKKMLQQKVFHNQPLQSCAASYHTTDKFAIARTVLLLCPSRNLKSCSVHVEKVIVFSFCFCYLVSSCQSWGAALWKHCQASVVPPYCTILCLLCLLLCWQRIEIMVAKDGKQS